MAGPLELSSGIRRRRKRNPDIGDAAGEKSSEGHRFNTEGTEDISDIISGYLKRAF